MGDFKYDMSQVGLNQPFDTTNIFFCSFVHSEESAIDDFIATRIKIFKLTEKYQHDIINIPPELTNMMLLGLVSAVESYMRKVLRLIITNDELSKQNCQNQVVRYGSVISHESTNMLAESLMEEMSFAGGYNIKNTITNLLGIKCVKVQLEPFQSVLNEYSKICELRHCVVHRFGFLGSHNAMNLGLYEHMENIEKPISINFDRLNEIALVCTNTVKVVNNFLFCEILERTFIQKSIIWTFDYRSDKYKFELYYKIFKDSSNQELPLDIYKKFVEALRKKYGDHYFKG